MTAVVLLATFALSGASAAVAANTSPGRAAEYTASVSGLPEIQYVGRSYLFAINVRNRGPWVKNFCIDFEDDNNSWLIRMPGLRAWDDDTFCYGTLRRGKKQFIARLVAAKVGQRKLSVTLGGAELYPKVNDAIILDENALTWSESFVIVG